MKSFRTRKSGVNRSVFGNVFILFVLLLIAAFMILPFFYSAVQAFKPMEEIFAYPPRFFVKNPTWDNFSQMWRISDSLYIPFSRYVFNTVFVTVVGIVLSMVVSTLAAFPLAKFDFPGNAAFSKLVTMALLFTGPVTALPQYIIVTKLGMFNTFWAVLLPTVGGPLNIFLMKNFFTQVPDSIIEAATIDGAGKLSILARVCLPLIRPAMLTTIIFTFQALWNSTGGNYIVTEDMKLLPTMMSQLSTSGIARTGIGAAASLMMIIPSLVIFVILQSRVVETMAYSGIKE